MANNKTSKIESISKQEYDDMVSAYKAEIRKLQKQLAKKQVEHESEIEKVRAEASAKNAPVISINFDSPPEGNKPD